MIYNDDSQEREFEHHIYGYDVDMKAVNTANLNVRAAGLSKDITIAQQDFKDFTQPAEKSIIVMNPPYGERISTPNLLNTYKMIGERFKRAFAGNEAWVLSYREECFEQIGLKPSIKIPVYNGSLECEFRKYVMFDGKMKEFRSEGGIVKTEREKSEMAQKHRFKKEREFKKRVTEEIENEDADIRSFQFHSHRLEDFEKRRNEIRVADVHVWVLPEDATMMMTARAAAASEESAEATVTTVTTSVAVSKETAEVARTSEESVAASQASTPTLMTRIKIF